ncbi:F-box/LRR-repeat protein 2-like isoform X2 [Anabrus simplex]
MEAAVNSLPSEVLETIFAHCTCRDLLQSIQNVCSRWREVAQSTRLWKDVTYCPEYKARSEEVVKMLKISPNLQNITLEDSFDDTVLQAITENCAELRKLEILTLPDLDLNFLKTLQEKCPKVQYLSIPHSVLTDFDKCEVVGKFTNLKVLNLTGDPDTNTSLILKPVADHCKKLEHLEFWTDRFEMNDLRHLLCMRKDTLHTLGVCCCNESGECVLPALSICELKSLSLFNYSDCWRHYEKIEYFGKLKTVRALSITDFNSEDESDDLKEIFENENMAQLAELKLILSTYFDDYVTEVLIKNCPLLKDLSLISCYRMTDASFKMITNFKELNSLTMSDTSFVTETGILHLQSVKYLKCLKISICKVGLRNIVKLSKLRHLSLEWQDLAEFPWDLVPHHMQNLQCLQIYHCRNVDTCALEKLKTVLPSLKVKVKVSLYEYCTYEFCLWHFHHEALCHMQGSQFNFDPSMTCGCQKVNYVDDD